jgi:hypothetical protein
VRSGKNRPNVYFVTFCFVLSFRPISGKPHLFCLRTQVSKVHDFQNLCNGLLVNVNTNYISILVFHKEITCVFLKLVYIKQVPQRQGQFDLRLMISIIRVED